MSYQAHSAFVAPARPRAELWRLIVGIFACAALYLALMLLFGILFQPVLSNATGSPAFRTLAIIFSFVLMTTAVAIVVRLIHRRSPIGLIGPLPATIANFWQVLKILAVLNAVLWVLPPYVLPELIKNQPLSAWLLLLLPSLLAILIQTSAEELVFRGYVQQQLAARFNSPVIWMLLPAVLFALGHYDPSENGENAWVIVIWAGCFGMMASDLTARSGNLGAAIGLHFFTNAFSILIISTDSILGGLALYHLPFGIADMPKWDPLILIDFGILAVSWLACRIAIRR